VNRAGGRFEVEADATKELRLAGTFATEQTDDLTGRGRETHSPARSRGALTDPKVAHVERRFGHRLLLPGLASFIRELLGVSGAAFDATAPR